MQCDSDEAAKVAAALTIEERPTETEDRAVASQLYLGLFPAAGLYSGSPISVGLTLNSKRANRIWRQSLPGKPGDFGGNLQMASRRAAKKGFLADYSVEDRYLLRPDRAKGRAGILRARDASSREVLIKFWPRAKDVDDSDLEDIWRSEIRQLQRLAAVPRADDLFVHMLTSGKDKDGFFVVLDPGQGSPLESFQQAAKKPGLLAQARQPRVRRILWENARRLAEALELLHSQGAIHRNLDPIFVSLDSSGRCGSQWWTQSRRKR
jgi:serine/threonine protein kinase